jgi:hypothetical protein
VVLTELIAYVLCHCGIRQMFELSVASSPMHVLISCKRGCMYCDRFQVNRTCIDCCTTMTFMKVSVRHVSVDDNDSTAQHCVHSFDATYNRREGCLVSDSVHRVENTVCSATHLQ